ncbi:G2/M phase-specific E3 ubiquitin-protein ligase-like [Garra rufa]|uniref:G2/M phase-specific E3 ubiquitin-protein ligase-like n=1 Tax=Garra rufa TaxID=137080 RepID=UPI003CCE77AC
MSNNGKNILFVVPLQEQLSIEPLPFDSVEFAKMPQSNCMKCGRKMPLPLLPLHIEECKVTETKSVTYVTVLDDEDENVSGSTDQPSSHHTDLEQSSQICPICQISFPTDVISYHASMCGEGGRAFSGSDSPSTSTREELPGPSTSQSTTSLSAEWKNETDPQNACRMFCEELLSQNAHCPSLSLLLNQFDTVDEQDSTLVSFYKMNSANWSAPFKCRLTGDAAVGKGVNRHVLSLMMQKLKTGFALNLGASAAALFEGEKKHCVPSASAVLRDSNLFRMAGRMIGHSFLHGGPCLSGLSLPVAILLTGGNADSAASALTLEDCPDLDHRETISLLKKTELTEEEMTRLTDLCLFWDLPVPSLSNRDWLFQQLLSHAVLGRIKCQIKDLRKGIKDTGIWPLLSQRLDSHHVVFPRESVRDITSQEILQKIVWPKPVDDEDDEDNDDSISVEKLSVITGYMRSFIEEASPTMLNHLMKFWVGWELPEENLVLELVTAKFPVAHTCFNALRLPCHYQTYAAFKGDMLMCLNSVNSGFGLV